VCVRERERETLTWSKDYNLSESYDK